MVTEESFLTSIFSDAKACQTMGQAIMEEIHLSRLRMMQESPFLKRSL
jgi:hypothetical protein